MFETNFNNHGLKRLEKINQQKENILTEEATKNAFIMLG